MPQPRGPEYSIKPASRVSPVELQDTLGGELYPGGVLRVTPYLTISTKDDTHPVDRIIRKGPFVKVSIPGSRSPNSPVIYWVGDTMAIIDPKKRNVTFVDQNYGNQYQERLLTTIAVSAESGVTIAHTPVRSITDRRILRASRANFPLDQSAIYGVEAPTRGLA